MADILFQCEGSTPKRFSTSGHGQHPTEAQGGTRGVAEALTGAVPSPSFPLFISLRFFKPSCLSLPPSVSESSGLSKGYAGS